MLRARERCPGFCAGSRAELSHGQPPHASISIRGRGAPRPRRPSGLRRFSILPDVGEMMSKSSVCPCILCRILHVLGLGKFINFPHWPWDQWQETVPLADPSLLYGAARAAALMDLRNFGARPAAASSSLPPERRARQRFALRLPMVITAGGSEIHAVTHDASSGGVFFYADDWPLYDGIIEFNMPMPSELILGANRGVRCRGRVVRTEEGANGRRGIAARIDSYELT